MIRYLDDRGDLIEQLERAVDAAKRGELHGFAAIVIGPKGESWSGWTFRSGIDFNFLALLGAVAVLQQDILGHVVSHPGSPEWADPLPPEEATP